MRKIIGMLVVTLLLTTAIPVIGTTNSCRAPEPLPMVMQGVKDQSQEDCPEKDWIQGGEWQEFVPQGKDLIRVEVHIGCYFAGSHPITLSIEKPLGTIAASKTLPAAVIPLNSEDWVSFQYLNATLQPGQTYYIVLNFDPGSEYSWSGAWANPYPAGVSSRDPDWDYCFKTFVTKSKPKVGERPEITTSLQMPSPPVITVTDPLTPIKIAIAPDVHIMGYVTDDTGINGFGYVIEYADGTGMGPYNSIHPPVTYYPFDIHEYVKEGINYLKIETSDIDDNTASEDVTIIYIKTRDVQLVMSRWSHPLFFHLLESVQVLAKLLHHES